MICLIHRAVPQQLSISRRNHKQQWPAAGAGPLAESENESSPGRHRQRILASEVFPASQQLVIQDATNFSQSSIDLVRRVFTADGHAQP
jgi:hypothetical protein